MEFWEIVRVTLIVIGILVGLYVAINLIIAACVGVYIVADEIRYPRQRPPRILQGTVINKTHNGISGGNYTGRDL